MLIANIIPYERNARDNSKNIPAIAASIEEFGFQGQIILRSHDKPVIVAGHHRVAACKHLGWTEIPEENICWCDNLTDDEVNALRLADNRTHEGGIWNKGLLKSEVKSCIKAGLDMSRFNFDYKSNLQPFGAERARTDDTYNLDIVNHTHTDGKYDIPLIDGVDFVPTELLPFNYAKSAKEFNKTLHFFVDDYQFERLWNRPAAYLELIQKFEAVLTPDFSMYMDMPRPMQMWNEYRRRALGNYWQRNGVTVIPTLSWTTKESFLFAFDGLPKSSTLAVSTVGVMADDRAFEVWQAGMKAAIKTLTPKRLILYGGQPDFNFKDIEIYNCKANTAFVNV